MLTSTPVVPKRPSRAPAQLPGRRLGGCSEAHDVDRDGDDPDQRAGVKLAVVAPKRSERRDHESDQAAVPRGRVARGPR